jgi:hypothetical protein
MARGSLTNSGGYDETAKQTKRQKANGNFAKAPIAARSEGVLLSRCSEMDGRRAPC